MCTPHILIAWRHIWIESFNAINSILFLEAVVSTKSMERDLEAEKVIQETINGFSVSKQMNEYLIRKERRGSINHQMSA